MAQVLEGIEELRTLLGKVSDLRTAPAHEDDPERLTQGNLDCVRIRATHARKGDEIASRVEDSDADGHALFLSMRKRRRQQGFAKGYSRLIPLPSVPSGFSGAS